MDSVDKELNDVMKMDINEIFDKLDECKNENKCSKNRQILIDTPRKKKEILDERKKIMNNTYNVKNAFNAEDLTMNEVDEYDDSVDKLIETILSVLFGLIQDVNDDGQKYLDFNLMEDFEDELKNLSASAICYIQEEVADYLTLQDFDVETYFENDEDNNVETNIHVEW